MSDPVRTRPGHGPETLPDTDDRARVRHALAHASHLLPAQNPLDRFVHHNPLHAFEDRRFEEAVTEASTLYGTQPWWSEDAYRTELARGRVLARDLDRAIAAEVQPGPVAGVVERHDLARALMLHPIRPVQGERLAWELTETDALRRPRRDLPPEVHASLVEGAGGDDARAVKRLWAACDARRPELPAAPSQALRARPRVRDAMVQRGFRDPDVLVHPVLIRWMGGYLDQGVAYWPMAERDDGFYRAFLDHFASPVDVGRPWLSTARRLVREARSEGTSAEELAVRLLHRLGHPMDTWDDVVFDTLLALRGWFGMFQRLADRPDVVPERVLPTSLADGLAIRLILDVSAAEWLLDGLPGASALERACARPRIPERPAIDPVWHLFQVAQILGLPSHTVEALPQTRVDALLEEVHALSEVRRRQIWHGAYERRFTVRVLDAVGAHARRAARVRAPAVRVQVAFCIDDREESMRRALEEVAPWVETLGVAGNYGIAMVYQGLEHGHPVALGPAGAPPRHLVTERAVSAVTPSRVRGLLHHHVDVGSQTLVRGTLVSVAGALAGIPLALRVLAPRLHGDLTRRARPEVTELVLERTDDTPDAHGLLVGFSLEERAAIVRGTLEVMGLTRDLAPLVVCLGHGSRSMNNPHEAAHDCGACGGGRGGPNARAFARMANEPAVREALAASGLEIPADTWFVGGYHDTADDRVDLYDLHRVPEALQAQVRELREAMDSARTLDAHERCRRFDAVPLDATPREALLHVEGRVEDLAQPRPEYGHCTNAICLVGRRAWSRGLFLDRRAFLVSYDPTADRDARVLSRLLGVVVPVGAGISLEYWFSVIDPTRWGCGTKLPHNVTGLVGVMDGHQSDLRTGLPWQMVELHEPVRLLCVVEATPAALLAVAERDPVVARNVVNGWVQLACIDPRTGGIQVFEDGAFVPWRPESEDLPTAATSREWYTGSRGFLPPASILPGGRG